MDEPRLYRVTVEDPDGGKVVVFAPESQVKLFKGDTRTPFATAAWIGYTDLWAQEV